MISVMAQTDALTLRVIEAYERLRNLGLVKNKREFAEKAGFMQQYWTGFEKGTRKASIAVATTIAKHFGLSLNYLITGEGGLSEQSAKNIVAAPSDSDEPLEVYVEGPLVDMPHVDLPYPDFKTLAHFGQQPGLSLKSFINSPTLRVYLRPGELPSKYDNAMVIEIWGDSMEPELHSGDRMIVWQVPESKWESLHNTACVVAYDDTVTIKAIIENDLFVHDRLTLRAANPASGYFVVGRESIHSIWEVREYYDRPKYSLSFSRR